MSETQAPAQNMRILIAAAVAFTIAMIPNWLQPVLMAEILAQPGMTESAAGLILTAEIVALSLSSALYVRFAQRISFRTLLIGGVLLAAVGNVISLLAPAYAALLAARLLCGIGEGAAQTVSSAAPARLADPDRAYGQINVSNILVGMALVFAAPLVGQLTGGPMTFPTMLICLAVLFPLVFVMPRGVSLAAQQQSVAAGEGRALSWPIGLVSLAGLLITSFNGALWVFFIIFGARAGLGEADVNHAITIAIGSGLAGCLLVSVIGSRFGRLLPMAVGLALLCVASFSLGVTSNSDVFRWGAALYMMATYFIVPYLYGFAAAFDRSGRGAAIAGGAFFMAQALGPVVGGVVAEHLGYNALGWFAIVANGLAFLSLIAAQTIHASTVRVEAAKAGA